MGDFYGRHKNEKDRIRAMAMGAPVQSYKILQVNLLNETDKQRAAAISAMVRTGQECHKLQGEGFSYRDLDLRGRCGVILYKGVEVSLLFKMEVVERTPGPAEPVPPRTLKEPEEAWIQIDLTNLDSAGKQKGLSEKVRMYRDQVTRLQMLWKKEEGERERLESELDGLTNIRNDLKATNERMGLAEEAKAGLERQIEALNTEVRTLKAKAQDEKKKIIEEMFPVFNTLWLAGVHRVADSLYGALKGQLITALRRIGVDLIEPSFGDEFDPSFHEAIHAKEFPEGAREIGTVIETHSVGWKFSKGPVFKAADVVVGIQKKELTGEF